MNQEGEVAVVCLHPGHRIHVPVDGHVDCKVGKYERGRVPNTARPGLVHREHAERRQVENAAILVALGGIEVVDEILAESPCVLGGVRVVTELLDPVRVEEDVNVVRLKRPRPGLARAPRLAFHGVRVRVRRTRREQEH